MSCAQGKIYIITGNGKGKTTTALGLGVRAAAAGRKVYMVQFLKGGGYSGELYALDYLPSFIEIKQFGYGCPIGSEIRNGTKLCRKCGQCFKGNRDPVNRYAQKAFDYAKNLLINKDIDFLILDEISHAVKHKFITADDVLSLIDLRSPHVDIVLTGRLMPQEVIAIGDEVTECVVKKHPITKGIDARRGIEY